ncbi:putative clathrin assembly protein [Cinnamomum micranthum f. kanehirae]|uniref:Putative clathrin assembly protein n=1 Tax=Cinnamomum micranthum f. kanehirae TaxID=337451 RepID=A0A443PGS8_9MAGN|nr:putative clathrin assembly protein [Cinnamomum micranthum f. kanehirae]
MGRIRKPLLRDLVGNLKDTVSLTKAALLSNPNTSMAVLRATSHDTSTPAHEKHVSALLSLGHGSRLTASSCVSALMDRLHNTHSPSVALKCLIAFHNILRRGSFILQDQLSIYPSTGGRNYLNLSNFHDPSTPESWQLSSWVRWYARALEQLVFTSRIVGFFLSSSSSFANKSKNDKSTMEAEEEKVTALSNAYLLKEIGSLVGVVEEISKAPDYDVLKGNGLVLEVMRLVGEDNLMTQKEILVRLMEMRERLSCLSFSESVELVCVMNRLKNCKRLLMFLTLDEKLRSGDLLLGLVGEMEEKVKAGEGFGEETRLVGRGNRSESARLDGRVTSRSLDLVRFCSARMETWADSSCY